MISPLKLLLFALFTAAVVAYFGEKFIDVTRRIENQQAESPQPSGDDLVYADVKMTNPARSIRVPMAADGHFWVTLTVNGTPVRFVVDTGASHVSLSHQDAAAIGLDPAGLRYNRLFRTANGDARKAMVLLSRMSLESIQMSDVRASVSPPDRMTVSLLGMNFLNRLSGFGVEDGVLVLKP